MSSCPLCQGQFVQDEWVGRCNNCNAAVCHIECHRRCEGAPQPLCLHCGRRETLFMDTYDESLASRILRGLRTYTLLLRFVSPLSMTIRAGACAGGAAVGSDDAWRFSMAFAATKITPPSVTLPAKASQKYMNTMMA